jgi:hypothetical protein
VIYTLVILVVDLLDMIKINIMLFTKTLTTLPQNIILVRQNHHLSSLNSDCILAFVNDTWILCSGSVVKINCRCSVAGIGEDNLKSLQYLLYLSPRCCNLWGKIPWCEPRCAVRYLLQEQLNFSCSCRMKFWQ